MGRVARRFRLNLTTQASALFRARERAMLTHTRRHSVYILLVTILQSPTTMRPLRLRRYWERLVARSARSAGQLHL